MATKLKNLKVTSVDVVTAGANPDAHICLFKDKTVKTEGGNDYPAAAYAYVPDPEKSSTWKLRLWEDPEKKVTTKQVGMAVAALGAGFRGKKVDIPEDDLPKVKTKVLAAWKKVNPDASDDDIPEALKSDTKKGFVQKMLSAIAKALGVEIHLEKDGDAETFDDAYIDRTVRELTDAACSEMWDMTYALQDSMRSIIMDTTLTADERAATMTQSLDEFSAAITQAVASWSQALPTGTVQKVAITDEARAFLEKQQTKIGELLNGGNPAGDPKSKEKKTCTQKGVIDTMKIDKSKMTSEEAAQLEALEKKYGTPDDPTPAPTPAPASAAEPAPVGKSTDMNPEVKKALEEMQELKKSLETERMTIVAKKYEVLGKKPDEVAKKLVDLKKAGGTAYDDYVALLDEQVNLVEKSGLFKEIGSNAEGGGDTADKINKAAADVQKADPNLSHAQAITKAFELNPELKAEYEKGYSGR